MTVQASRRPRTCPKTRGAVEASVNREGGARLPRRPREDKPSGRPRGTSRRARRYWLPDDRHHVLPLSSSPHIRRRPAGDEVCASCGSTSAPTRAPSPECGATTTTPAFAQIAGALSAQPPRTANAEAFAPHGGANRVRCRRAAGRVGTRRVYRERRNARARRPIERRLPVFSTHGLTIDASFRPAVAGRLGDHVTITSSSTTRWCDGALPYHGRHDAILTDAHRARDGNFSASSQPRPSLRDSATGGSTRRRSGRWCVRSTK